MKIIGIICEYNPLHLGHQKQMRAIRSQLGEDCALVCLMSGNFVQRGAPAVFHKSVRAEAALACGADLVLELPVSCALSSAESFAAGAVKILSGFCDGLSFGTESGTAQSLMETAEALLSPRFSLLLRKKLNTGISFPAARQSALEGMGLETDLTRLPNDILAVEYCKAILSQGSFMEILPIRREGGYHDPLPHQENPSATALRRLITNADQWESYVPPCCRKIMGSAAIHTLQTGEIAMLAKLRTMTDAEFESLPYGSEGLWRKLMHAVRQESTLEQILGSTKSKRYTRSRLDRMVMCAFLGLTAQDLGTPAPYTRVLGFSEVGRTILKKARSSGVFLHTGEAADHPYWELEQRCSDLYGLFCVKGPEPAGQERRQRVIFHK